MTQRNVEVAARVGIFTGSQLGPYQVFPESGVIALPDFQSEFDFVFSSHDNQKVYEFTTSNLIENLFQGFDSTVISYGQANTGKTYTMFGPGTEGHGSPSYCGLLAFAAQDICDRIEKVGQGRNISLSVSYYEIQNDDIHDLLTADPSSEVFVQQIDEVGTVVIAGLTEIECVSLEQILCCLETGLRLRSQQSETSFGSALSRHSHMIFTIQLKQRWIQGDVYIESCSKINFVDLAGSERIGSNIDGAGYNSGLLALNTVITSLGDPRRKAHYIPYWDSKLTMILKNALGGNSLTLFFCCISPNYEDMEETLSTLHIGACARNIVNTIVNHTVVKPVYEAYAHLRSPANNIGFRPTYNNQYPSDRFFMPITPVPEESVVYSLVSEKYRQQIEEPELPPLPEVAASVSESRLDEGLKRTSDTSVQDQIFKLHFAVSQMLVLIRNAQDLLAEISADDEIQSEYRNRAEAWLCLKQECEECLAPDLGYGSGSIDRLSLSDEAEGKSLEVIEEVSEPTATHSTATTNQRRESDAVIDLAQRLKLIRQQFRVATDKLLWSMDDSRQLLLEVLAESEDENGGSKNAPWSESDDEEEEAAPPPRRFVPAPRRRQSIFQGMVGDGAAAADPGLVMKELKDRLGEDLEVYCQPSSPNPESPAIDFVHRSTSPGFADVFDTERVPPVNLAASEPLPRISVSEPQLKQRTFSERRRSSSESVTDEELKGRVAENALKNQVREVAASTESKKVQVRQASCEMKSVKRTLKELKSTIEIKQALLNDLEKAEEHSEIAQRKFERRMEKLEHHIEEYKQRMRKEQEKLQRWEESGKGSEGEDETVEEVEKKIEKFRIKIDEDEKRLNDLENLRSLLGRDPGRIEELRRSLSAMRQKQEELLNQLETEGERKRKMEEELLQETQRIRELEKLLELQQCNNQIIKLRNSRNEEEAVDADTPSPFCSGQSDRWRASASQTLNANTMAVKEDLRRKEERISELERRLRDCQSTSRLSLAKSVQTDGEDAVSRRGQDELRYEIRKLRKVRDSLMCCKQQLDEIRLLDRQLEPFEERRLLEYEEAIEAVDWAIEYKNQLICGNDDANTVFDDLTDDQSLLARLNRLSLVEIKCLFTKYFKKVVDLREGCKKVEQQVVELEDRLKHQTIDYRKMHDKLQRTRIDAEWRIGKQQREYEQQIVALVQQLGEDSSGSSAAERRLRQMESEVEHLRKENRVLKANLSDMMIRLGAVKEQQQKQQETSRIAQEPQPSTSSSRGPFSLLPVLHGFKNKPAKTTITTQVTRQKNKLIIEEKNKDQRRHDKR